MIIKRIVVPVDFSRPSLKALEYAIEFGRLHKAELIVVYVIEPMNYAVPRLLPEPTVLLEDQRRVAAKSLSRLEAGIRKRYPNCRTEVHFGVVYQTIIEVAKRLKADLIVIATLGRTGLSHLMIGSVAERVVRGATCPVLTVRAVAPKLPTGKTRRASDPHKAASRRPRTS